MMTYSDRIVTYFAKFEGNTQICKKEVYQEQNTTGRIKIGSNLKREKLQDQSPYLEC